MARTPTTGPYADNSTALGLTTTTPNTMVIVVGTDFGDSPAGTITPPSGFTERVDTNLCYVADKIQPTASAVGNVTFPNNSNNGSAWAAWMLAAQPAVGRPKVYLAGSFQKKPAKIWNGSAWVEKPMKVWTGSAWKTLT